MPTSPGGVCGRCQRRQPAFDSTVAAYAYEFPLDELVAGLKYGHSLQAAGFFAERLGMAVVDRGDLPDLVVAMPLHPVRLRARGFNQAVEIARPLVRQLGSRLNIHVLVRDVDTMPQVGLPWSERAANVRGAFRCLDNLNGLNVAVVDDVMTTGATLHEVARCLKGRGAAKVVNWVVARTP